MTKRKWDVERKVKRGFKIPYVVDVPVEAEVKISSDIAQDNAYLKARDDEKNRKWSNLGGNFRRVADTLSDHFKNHMLEEVSYEQIAEESGLSESLVRQIIGELATWKQYQFTIIASPKKKGFFQLSTHNLEDTEKWIKTKARNLATGQQRLWKTEESVAGKRVIRKRGRKAKQIIVST